MITRISEFQAGNETVKNVNYTVYYDSGRKVNYTGRDTLPMTVVTFLTAETTVSETVYINDDYNNCVNKRTVYVAAPATEDATPAMNAAQEPTTAAPILLETVADALARLDAAAMVKYYADETAAMYDGESGAIDESTLDASWKALEAVNPEAFRKWNWMVNPIAEAHPDKRTPEIMQQIEAVDLANLRKAYGIM